jgi:hypothetical protein
MHSTQERPNLHQTAENMGIYQNNNHANTIQLLQALLDKH